MKSVLMVFFLSFAFYQAQAQKIGYINSQEVIAIMPEVKEANSSLETYNTQLQKRAEQMYKALETKATNLQAKKDGGEVSPKQLEIELAALQQEEQKRKDSPQMHDLLLLSGGELCVRAGFVLMTGPRTSHIAHFRRAGAGRASVRG